MNIEGKKVELEEYWKKKILRKQENPGEAGK